MKTSHKIATCLTAILTVLLFVLGMQMLTLPAITLFKQFPYYILPKGPAVLVLALLAAWFRSHVTQAILWLGGKIHRWLTLLAALGIASSEGALHFFSIPHPEGWWIPLLGCGAIASVVEGLLHGHKHKHSSQTDVP